MATPQSLPSHPTTTHTQMPPQLPLPSASASSAQRPAEASDSRLPGSPTATSTARARHSLVIGEPARSPTFNTFHTQISPTSTTHAGGIQPSASFFRPSRPSQQVQFSRPSSAGSSGPDHNLPPILAPDGDIFQLAPLTKQDSDASSAEEDPTSNEGPGDSTAEGEEDLHRKLSSSGRAAAARQTFSPQHRTTKRSREPLLPIGGRGAAGSNSRPPVSRGVIEGNAPVTAGPLSPSGATRRFRSSIERVFRRGLSFDSTRRSSSTRPPTVDDGGQQTLERKVRDEERGMYPAVSTTKVFPASIATVSPSATPLRSTFVPGPSETQSRSAVPIVDPITRRPVRNYQSHPSRNKFFFNGRLLTGGDSPWAFVATVILVLGIAGTWFATTCVWWWHNESPALAAAGAYMCLVVISSMLTTAMRDPGILPRNLDPDPPYPNTPSDGGTRVALPRDLKVRADIVRVKYCPTCRTYRPPRSSHCKMCDNCVDGCDHHCQWVNNCVGRRNYTSFFVFLTTATATLILVIVSAALHIFFLVHRERLGFQQALQRAAGSAVVFCLSIAVVWPVAALLSYHLRLLLLNVTTIEQIRNQAHKSLVQGPPPPNPFSHGTWRRNLLAVLCRPAGYSWLNAGGIAAEDKREVNPGMTGWDEREGR